MIFLQLPLFNKKQEECKTRLDKWTYIMKNLESLKDIPWREQEEAFNEIAKVANLAAMTEEEQNRYDDALRELQDAYSVFEYAMITGKNDGIKEVCDKQNYINDHRECTQCSLDPQRSIHRWSYDSIRRQLCSLYAKSRTV